MSVASAFARFCAQPLWLVGFRPFFILACLSGMALPLLWALIFSGVLVLPASQLSILQWHAHEMFFGFGWAVLGGFLLTSSKNWVKVRGFHGGALVFLVLAWVGERLGMWFGAAWSPLLFAFSNALFLSSIVAMVMWTLLRHRQQDAYRDNVLFLFLLPAFLLAKYLLLDAETYSEGWNMTLGLFRLAFLVMLERTLTQFMQGAFQLSLRRLPVLDYSIKLLALGLVAIAWLPVSVAAGLEMLLAALLLGRFMLWKPQFGLRRIEIAVMYLGYLGIVSQLMLDALDKLLAPAWVGSLPAHIFTFGVIGLIVPAMMIRICNGHTGRKVVFAAADKSVLYLMLMAFVCRIILPQWWPAIYLRWIEISALCWLLGFAILAWCYVPLLLRPRIDGREH